MSQTAATDAIQSKPHLFYADFLRALATVAVITLHNAADPAAQYGHIPQNDWLSAAFYNGLCRFCVPMFVVLSGSLLLSPKKDVTIKELFSKRLPKLVIPLVFWSAFYMLFYHYFDKTYPSASFLYYLKAFYSVPLVFHFWFLYMMTGIYLAYPIINLFIRSATESQVLYFIVIWFIANCVLGIIDVSLETANNIELHIFTGYIGYFVLGYYLKSFSFSKRTLNTLYTLCVIAFIASIAGIILLQVYQFKHATDLIESDVTPEIPFAVAGLFLFMKNYPFSTKQQWWKKIANHISQESYGIYILHVLCMQLMFGKGFLNIDFGTLSLLWVIPIKMLMALSLAFIMVKILKRVPLLNRTI
ncbi:acyltransferase [Mucilaginibacter flavus]|uniref:acyltransferase n=1 Tax=Mucilaginibacter flavus TaxID=931504 RepID=UPI0025B4C607|nr:acyltransferase family protein [Mucilaginibacter flavus]MDN3580599.1 acyltransferase family protein [Mucilaginibacter flavus]